MQYCRIDGSTDGDLRDSQMEEFNAPDSKKFLFMLSTRAGGLGINLYTADVVILYDSDWNPQADLQAQDRAHRIGQKKQVRVFRFISESTVEEKIIERAEKKLYLDAVVIQQGRLMEQNKSLSKGEMGAMIKFGADDIFRKKEGQGAITDEDVDAILARGEERTKEMKERIQSGVKNNLRDFTLDGGFDESQIIGVEEKDGSGGLGLGNMIALPQRARKTNYDVNQYYRDAMRESQTNEIKTTKIRDHRKIKPPTMHDYQFFDRKRIEAIVSTENDLAHEKRVHLALIKDHRQRESKERRKVERQYEARRKKEARGELAGGDAGDDDDDGEGGGEGGGEAAAAGGAGGAGDGGDGGEGGGDDGEDAAAAAKEAAKEAIAQHEMSAGLRAEYEAALAALPDEASKLEAELHKFDLPAEIAEEKKRLLAEGFSGWGRRELKLFINACEKFGRKNKQGVYTEVVETTGKPEAEVRRYFRVFFERGSELADHDKILDRIAKGEAKLERIEAISRTLRDKVNRHSPHPWQTLVVGYGSNKGKAFTEEEDRFLVCMMDQLGYGQWEQLKLEIRKAWQFRFDWFLKSRTTAEIQRRCDTLVRLIEKEVSE